MFQILSPLRSLDEVDTLIISWADEFYCGFFIGESANLNDRPNTEKFNFWAIEELKSAIVQIHFHNKKLYLALNSTKMRVDVFEKYYPIIQELWVDAFIISDVYLLDFLSEKNCLIPIHLSTIIGTANSMGIQYFLNKYKSLSITRVCLERTITKESLQEIIKKSSIEIEFFIFSGNCKYSEGHCNIHKYSNSYSQETRVHEKKVRCSYHCMQVKNHDITLQKQIHSGWITSWFCHLAEIQSYIIENKIDTKIFLKIAGRWYDSSFKNTIVSSLANFIGGEMQNPETYYQTIVWSKISHTHNCTY